MMRLFVALSLPDHIKDALLDLGPGIPGASWVPYDNLHLTLRFLGEVRESEAADIDEVLSGISAPAFDLTLRGVNHFGPLHKARSVWASVERSPALAHLRDKVDAAVVRAGLQPERRKFIPHVTLARIKGETGHHLADYLARGGLFSAGPFAVTHFTLYESFLSSNGAIYEPLAQYPLTGVPAYFSEPMETAA